MKKVIVIMGIRKSVEDLYNFVGTGYDDIWFRNYCEVDECMKKLKERMAFDFVKGTVHPVVKHGIETTWN